MARPAAVAALAAFAVGVGVGLHWRAWTGSVEDAPGETEEVPADCPGLDSEAAGKASACEGCPNQKACASGEKQVDPAVHEVARCLRNVKHKILVLSGKGGVGKSTVSTQLAFELAAQGLQVGLLDVDICGPSLPLMCGVRGQEVHRSASGFSPVPVNENLCVLSIGFMLPELDSAVIWRGPKKNGLIRQFLSDVDWGQLDVLVVDTPPGTSDEHMSVISYLSEAGVDGAVVVTTPQEAALADVRKEINFCHETKLRVLGVVENMANSVFDAQDDAVRRMCRSMDVDFLGSLALLADFVKSGDGGRRVDAEAREQVRAIVEAVAGAAGITL